LDHFPLLALVSALVFLLVLSAFFAMAETGMMAVNRYRLRALERTGPAARGSPPSCSARPTSFCRSCSRATPS